MSKWYEEKVDEDGIKRRYIEVFDRNDCTHKYNDICCYGESEYVADYPYSNYCKRCKHFFSEEQAEKIIREEISKGG